MTTLDLEHPDLLAPELYGDLDSMHATFRAMRRQPGLHRDEANQLWAAVHHADLIEIERRPSVLVSGQGYRSLPSPGELDMIALDDPEHAEQRSLVARRFTPKAVTGLEPFVSGLIDELIDGFLDHGELEVVGQLAAPLPARLTAHLLGFSEDLWPQIKTWSERLMRYDSAFRDPDVMGGFAGAITEFSQALLPIIQDRRAQPADDLVSVWSHAQLGGCPMDEGRIVQETGLVISGGAETTRTVIGRGLAELCAHPDDWEAMAADPDLVPGAVEELVRWVTPLNNFFRTAVADAVVGGTEIAAGDRIMLLYPSANRDEAVFEQPDVLDIHRSPNPHVAFGLGPHFCLGASLARLELRILFERLTAQITNLRLIEPPDIEPNIFVGAVRSCRVGFNRR